jgi:hypothetical protein
LIYLPRGMGGLELAAPRLREPPGSIGLCGSDEVGRFCAHSFRTPDLYRPCSNRCGFDMSEAVQQEQVEPSLRGLPQYERKPTPLRARKTALIKPIDSATSRRKAADR